MLNFDLYCDKRLSNRKGDALSRCLEFTRREGGTPAGGNELLIQKER